MFTNLQKTADLSTFTEEIPHGIPSSGIFKKSFSENMHQIYRRTTMPKCDFSEVAMQLY